jgi:cation diffusion facilitator CzcD-associated flavoprotein CzcO
VTESRKGEFASQAHRVVVIGAGFGGIGASIKLAEQGIEHVILEKADDVGGTWWANRYPGCRCDVPSHLYSFSFAPNPDWSDSYSLRPEIWRYLRRVAEERGVIDRIRFGCKVEAARWDDAAKQWGLETSDGPVTCDVLIAAHGFLSEPRIPHFEGIETFSGQVMHSAEWDPSYDVRGKRVAVIGTGASAVQIVPEVHRDAEHLFVFQRTAAWILPHRGRTVPEREKALYRRVPAVQRAVRAYHYWSAEFVVLPALAKNPSRTKLIRNMAIKHLEEQVPDPELRAKLTPSFVPGCKRLTPSNDYLPAIASPSTTLVTEGIDRIEPSGIRTVDGVLHEVDVIILATGFRVTDNTFSALVTGRDGRTLQETWEDTGMSAYNGTTIAGFPNLFMLVGPNTGIGHTSVIYMIEAQLTYLIDALGLMSDRGIRTLDARPDVQAAYNEELQRKLAPSVWNTGGCVSWYLDKNGRNPTIWPDYTFKFARRLKQFDLDSYYQELEPADGRMLVGAK